MVTVPSPDAGCTPGTSVLAPELLNGRDLGGIATPNGPLQCGQLFRSAAPSGLKSSGCAGFAQLGIKTVIDLREASERLGTPFADCVTQQVTTVIAPLPIPYSVSAADYLADLHTDASITKVFETMADDASWPMLFNCTYGRDRTGIVAAMVLQLAGASREDILVDYRRTADSGLSITPASLEAALDELDRLGGAEAHLLSLGLSADAVANVRRHVRGN